MNYIKTLFLLNDYKASIFRPIGAGLTLAIPLFLGLFLNDPKISSIGVMGSFAYLIFQEISLSYNIKAILLHGTALFLAFLTGLISGIMPWTVPFVVSLISFSGFFLSKIYRVPKPDYFFVLMIYVTGTTINPVDGILNTSFYLIFGLLGALITGCLISLFIGLPIKTERSTYSRKTFSEKYHLTIQEQPDIALKAMHFSMILFGAAYIAYLLSDYNGHWVLISAAAILAAEKIDRIKMRSVQRSVGGLIGLLLGSLLIHLTLPQPLVFLLLVIFSTLIEYFMPRNYVIANFFTNPQVLLITSMTATSYSFVSHRLSGIIIGSLLVVFLVVIEDYGFSLLHHKEHGDS